VKCRYWSNLVNTRFSGLPAKRSLIRPITGVFVYIPALCIDLPRSGPHLTQSQHSAAQQAYGIAAGDQGEQQQTSSYVL
jgi:hypothetical protein